MDGDGVVVGSMSLGGDVEVIGGAIIEVDGAGADLLNGGILGEEFCDKIYVDHGG